MMACILFQNHHAIELPLQSLVVNFEPEAEPQAEVTYIKKHEFLVYPGPWDMQIRLLFHDQKQMDDFTTVLLEKPEFDSSAA